MTANTPASMTLDEFLGLPDDGVRRELVRGEVRELAPATLRRMVIRHRIELLLGNFVHEHDLGIVGGRASFVLAATPPTVLAPDIVFIQHDRVPGEEDQGAFGLLAPDLAVEVISPSNHPEQMTGRVLLYLNAGVRMVWVVEPRTRAITVYTPDRDAHVYMEGETIDSGDVLPGFTLSVSDVFS